LGRQNERVKQEVAASKSGLFMQTLQERVVEMEEEIGMLRQAYPDAPPAKDKTKKGERKLQNGFLQKVNKRKSPSDVEEEMAEDE
jgi:hypothetical protein